MNFFGGQKSSQTQDLDGRKRLLIFFPNDSPCTIFSAVFAVQEFFFKFINVAQRNNGLSLVGSL